MWIREDAVLAIHRRQLAEHGGGEGIRDPGLLDSALARPKNLAADSGSQDGPDLAALAASYAWGLARNHPFVDGNKRTAYVTGPPDGSFSAARIVPEVNAPPPGSPVARGTAE